VEQMGMKAHFESIARGVLDTRDILYFISLTLFFLYLSINQLKNQNR
jgi:ABC-2 type transport system permease protein